jgi:phage-related protein
MNGLWNGLKSIWDNVQGWFNGLGDWIKEHKGPLSYDVKLLVPAGNAIMSGLHNSVVKSFRRTQKFFGSVGSEIQAAASLNSVLTYSGQPAIAAAYAGAGNGKKIDLTVNTQEIDPRKHAADLAYELASALGL